jgi:hypothetical protein
MVLALIKIRLNVEGQLEDLTGVPLTLKALRRLRRNKKTSWVTLFLPEAALNIQKIYLDAPEVQSRQLPALLWREVEQTAALPLSAVFYDYLLLAHSLTELPAYQLFWMHKADLKAVLALIRAAGLKIKCLSVIQHAEINLWPWRERDYRWQLFKQCGRLCGGPLFILGVLLFIYYVLMQRQHALAQRLHAYEPRVADYALLAPRLKSFAPALLLVQGLPQSVQVNEISWDAQGWQMQGVLESLQALATLNLNLIQLHWLSAQGSVDVYAQGQHYQWQLKN